MGGRIPQQFIDDLLGRVDIIDIIDSRVPLKKKGKDYMACCPFHNEKSPSFSVSQDKQFYYCFGCGASGSALGFLMDYEHMDFVEAIQALANQAGVEVPTEDGPVVRGPDLNPLLDILEKADSFFQAQLREHAQAARAVAYLKNRGLSGEVARDFGIGFAPPGWDNLLKKLGTDENSKKLLLDSGMVIQKDDDRVYDRFRDRIMFPIRDRRGRVIAFGGRVLDGDEQGAKYLNSPETPVFHKGKELYGLFEARKAVRDLNRLLVVEGYMDVVALAQYGIRYAVATLGTATTSEHLDRLFRVVPEVVFCFDGDRAGRKAAWRALENSLPILKEGRQAKFLFLPEGEDPDSLIRREGQEVFEARIKKATPLSEFMLENLSGEADTSSTDGRARFAELARPLLASIPTGIYRDLLIEQVAKIAQTDARRIAEHVGEAPVEEHRSPTAKPRPKVKMTHSLVEQAVRCLLHRPSLVSHCTDINRYAGVPLKGREILTKILELAANNPQITAGAIIEHWRETGTARYLEQLASESHLKQDDEFKVEFTHILKGLDDLLSGDVTSQRLKELQEKGLQNMSEADKTEYKQLLARQSSTPTA